MTLHQYAHSSVCPFVAFPDWDNHIQDEGHIHVELPRVYIDLQKYIYTSYISLEAWANPAYKYIADLWS